jgi:hypothetical protein
LKDYWLPKKLSSLELLCWSRDFLPGMFDPEDKGTTILRNVGNCLPNDKASHAKTLQIFISTTAKTSNLALPTETEFVTEFVMTPNTFNFV